MAILAVTRDTLIAARQSLAPGGRVIAEPVYGPPQPALDELWGETFTPDMVGDMGVNPFGEDAYSVDHRVKAAKWLLEAYEINRHRPVYPRVWYPPGLYMVSGKMGDGKTLCATNLGVIFLTCGWPVYSTAGLLFGKRLDESQTFAFPEFVTPGAFVFADEIHAIYGRYQGASIRNQTMAQATASFRKLRIYCFGATAREWLVGHDLKAAVLGLGYPYRSRPQSTPTAPPWAYRAIRWYYPEPWGGKELRESFGEGKQAEVKRYTEYPHSYDLTRAGLHFNSWEKIKLDFGGSKGAEAFRKDMNAAQDGGMSIDVITPDSVGDMILDWFADGYFNAALQAYNDAVDAGKGRIPGEALIPLTTLVEMFHRAGYPLGQGMVQRGLSAAGCHHSQRTVNVEQLEAAWTRKAAGNTYDPDAWTGYP